MTQSKAYLPNKRRRRNKDGLMVLWWFWKCDECFGTDDVTHTHFYTPLWQSVSVISCQTVLSASIDLSAYIFMYLLLRKMWKSGRMNANNVNNVVAQHFKQIKAFIFTEHTRLQIPI